MKFRNSLRYIIPILLIVLILVFAGWYFAGWYKPTGAVVPGAPMELLKLVQTDKELKVIRKGKEETVPLPEGKPYQYKLSYPDKVFIEQTVLVNGIPVKGTYRTDNGIETGFIITFTPGEKREYSLMLQIDWQVEKHVFLDRYRGKSWKRNISYR